MAKNKTAAVATETKRVRNDMESFIQAWKEFDGNAKKVGEKLGISPNSVTVRACQYRKTMGLPKATRQGGGARLDVEAGKALIEKLYATVAE